MQPARPLLLLGPGGQRFDQTLARQLASNGKGFSLLCGRYEGFDQRVHDHLANDAISIGPYVLSGGEVAAMAVLDAVTRKLPGALGRDESHREDSFSEALEGRPEYPHYTRPEEFRGWSVPPVLLSGDHGEVARWRDQESRRRAGSHL